MNIIEDLNLRFPHISEKILANLDNKSLALCREMSISMCDFIDNTKIPWKRIIKKYTRNNDGDEDLQNLWNKVLNRNSVNTVREIARAVRQFYTIWPLDIEDKKTPMHFAVISGQIEIILNIIERVNDKNPKDKFGKTPLHWAAGNGHLEICKLLIENLEDKNPKDWSGETPLHLAAENGHLEICQLIIENVAVKNPKTEFGITPLHWAARYGHLEICQLIIGNENVVDKNPMSNYTRYNYNYTGSTPSELAKSKEIREMILKADKDMKTSLYNISSQTFSLYT